jgi:hypothetical protein
MELHGSYRPDALVKCGRPPNVDRAAFGEHLAGDRASVASQRAGR